MPSPVRPVERERRLLIVGCGGYGTSEKGARAVLAAHRRGIVTSTSVRPTGPAFERTLAWLADSPRLGVGVQLVAVGDDPPLLSAAEIPTLLDRRGRLRSSWRQLVPLLTAGRVDPDDLRREFAAQFERVAERDVSVDHLDTAQDLQRWPVVAKVVVGLADRHGVGAVRVPRSSAHSPSAVVDRRLAHSLERRARHRGLVSPGASAGGDEAMDLPAIIRALHRLATSGARSAELVTRVAVAGSTAAASMDEELAALTSGTVRHAVQEYQFALGTFRDLARAAAPPRAAAEPVLPRAAGPVLPRAGGPDAVADPVEPRPPNQAAG
jgi:predicted glycoside hydrolase/deacetylase ChbG (UPF0249 family)